MRAAGHEVVVVGWTRSDRRGPTAGGELSAGRRAIETAAASRPTRVRWLARALARGEPFSVAKYAGRRYRDVAAGAGGADVVMIDHAQVGPSALAPAGAAPRVLVAHNVEHRVYDEQARAATRNRWLWRREARLMGRQERRLAAEAASVWTLSEDDARAFAALGAGHV